MSDNESYTDELFDGDDASISDAETVIASPDELFDGKDASMSDAETVIVSQDLSGDENHDAEEVIECDDAEMEDLTHLFGGNTLPPEYYQSTIEGFDDAKYKKRNYSEGMKILKHLCEELWGE